MTIEPTKIIIAPDGYREAVFGYFKIEEHRWFMMKKLGGPLERWEQVHHINRIKTDNRAENLELTPHGHNYVIMGVLQKENRDLKERVFILEEEVRCLKVKQKLSEAHYG